MTRPPQRAAPAASECVLLYQSSKQTENLRHHRPAPGEVLPYLRGMRCAFQCLHLLVKDRRNTCGVGSALYLMARVLFIYIRIYMYMYMCTYMYMYMYIYRGRRQEVCEALYIQLYI